MAKHTYHKLNHTKVYRGGLTSNDGLGLETENVTVSAESWQKGVGFVFHLASKGGGTTVVRLEIGPDDLPEILTAFLEHFPISSKYIIEQIPVALQKQQEVAEVKLQNVRTLTETFEKQFRDKFSSEMFPSEKAVGIITGILERIREKAG